LKTRVGDLSLQIPQVRESDFYPSALDKGIRSERALSAALAEMYINGISTRKVKKVTKELCGLSVTSMDVSLATKRLDEEMTSWRTRKLSCCKYVYFDARYEKIHDGGTIRDVAVLSAIGINDRGQKELLGVSVTFSEAEVHWLDFFSSLVERGLHGIELIISDAHEGLKAARKKVFASVKWQRCQFHLQQNAQAYVPKISLRKSVSRDIKSVFNAPDINEAKRLLVIVVDKYNDSAPKLSRWMEDNLPEGLTVFSFPAENGKKIRTSNCMERINREIKRRTRVVSIFPNEASCLRLVLAVLMEINQDWEGARKFMDMQSNND
jgi:transposase-like protein